MALRTHLTTAILLLGAALTPLQADTQAPLVKPKTTDRKKSQNHLETGGERKLNVVYKEIDRKALQLDLYYPSAKSSDPSPLIIYTHGGGWAAGSRFGASRGSFAKVFLRLLQEGFAVASVDYRLCKKNSGIMMRDCVTDSKDALRYLAKHSESLGLDSKRIYLFGDSAGGHIAQMLLLSSSNSLPGDKDLADTPYQVIAGVSWYGPCDFEKTNLFNHDDRPDFRDRFGPRILGPNSDPAKKLTLYREMSPISYLTKNSPPLLMIQGDQDTTIPIKHARHMDKKAKELGAPVEIMIIKNSGHNWRKVNADIEPTREEIEDQTVQFFLDHRSSRLK